MFLFQPTPQSIHHFRIISLIWFTTSCLFLNAQTLEWAKSFGGIYSDFSNSVAVDANGNAYTTGNFDNIVDFDPGQNTVTRSANGNNDMFVHKMDAHGNFVWVKTFGSITSENGNGLVLDNEDNIYITGYYAGTISFDSTNNAHTFPTKGSADIFILKLDSDGNTIWSKTIGGTMGDTGVSIALDNSGNIYTAGRFMESVDFDPGSDTFFVQSKGNRDIYIHKMDADGNFLWVKTIGGVENDVVSRIFTDADGDVMITGNFSGTLDFDPNEGAFNETCIGDVNGFILDLDADGNFQWVKVLKGTSRNYYNSISKDKYGNIFATGNFKDTVYLDNVLNTEIYNSNGGNDIFLQKMDEEGNVLWIKTLGSTGNDMGLCVTTDENANIYKMGVFSETIDFDEGPGIANLTSEGKNDIFIHKADADGNFLWAQSFGGPDDDYAYAIDVDVKGNIYATGNFKENVSFSNGVSPTTISSVGYEDVYILKLNQISTNTTNEYTENQVSIYPNPSNGLINVSFGNTLSTANLTLTDVSGRVVSTKKLDNVSRDEIHINGSAGIYFLHIRTEDSQSIIKLVKE